MELSYALKWMVATSAVFGLAMSLKQFRAKLRGWFYVNAFLLLTLGTGAVVGWRYTGYVAFALWLLLVILPNWIERELEAAGERGETARAAALARVAQFLHPFDGYPERFYLYLSHARFHSGTLAEAKAALYPLLTRSAWAERARLESYSLDAQWDRIVAHLQSQRVGTRDLQLATLYLRAFGELGKVESMWSLYGEIPAQVATLPGLSLLMASYSGLVDLTEQLLARYFVDLRPSHAVQLRAVALAVDGQADRARQELDRHIGAARDAAGSTWRRSRLPPEFRPDRATPTLQAALTAFRARVLAELQALPAKEAPSTSWATLALTLTLLGVFLGELPGGSTDPANLMHLGSLVIPTTLTQGGLWWRLIAAGFLHFGSTHLVMNVVGLSVLGKQIERLWGGLAMLAVFLGSSVGSFAFAALLVQATEAEPRVFLGASSGVLGLVGALAVHLATGYIGYGRKALGRRILWVAAVVAAQFVFDWFTPVVSSRLHVTGLLIGCVIAIPISLVAWRKHTAKERQPGTQPA